MADAPRVQTVKLSGEIDIAGRETLSEILALIEPCDIAVIDLRDVTFMDSTGMSALVATKRRLRQTCGAEVRLRVGCENVYRLLKTCGMDTLFTLSLEPRNHIAQP